MAESSAIEWTDATVNFWWGCTKVGPGCDHCYAEAWDNRLGGDHWGLGKARKWIKGSTALIRKLNRQNEKFFAEHGRHRRVFIQSMSDLLDNEAAFLWRFEALSEIEDATNLDIQIVTKRISNVEKLVLSKWRNGGWPRHVGLMITVCTQAEADRDIPRLLDLKKRLGIPWVGLSMEPLLERVDLKPEWLAPGQLDWVVVGGESGTHARPMHPDWARTLRDQCAAARACPGPRSGVPFLFKQWGAWAPGECVAPGIKGMRKDATWFGGKWLYDQTRMEDPEDKWDQPADVYRIEKAAAGRILDGRTHDAWPEGTR